MIQRIDLKVGFQCNNYCMFCVQGDKRERLPAKAAAELFRSLEDGRSSGAEGVVFTGGEPTLHPDILALVRRAKELGYKDIQLQSNGRSFCYPGLVGKLVAAGATEFGPSLHGSRPGIHDFLTGAAGSFLQTVAGMKNVKKAGCRLITNSVVTKANYRDLPDLARLLVSLGVDQYQFAFMHITGRAAQNREWLTARNRIIEPWVKKGLDVGIKAGRTVMTEAIPYCFMSGYEDHVAEKIIPRTKIYDADAVIEDFTKTRRDEGKAKGPRCPECRYCAVCEGPWREYPEMFGWDEFVPVSQASPAAWPSPARGQGRAAVGGKRRPSSKARPQPKRRGKALGLLLAAAVSGWAAAASAGPACTPVSDEDRRVAKVHFLKGIALYEKMQEDAAKREWAEALSLDPAAEDSAWTWSSCPAGLRPVKASGEAPPEGLPPVPEAAAPAPPAAPVKPASEDAMRSSAQHYLSGVIYFQKGDYAKARDEWRRALKLDPSNADALAGIKRVEDLYSVPAAKDGKRASQQHYLSGVVYFQKGDRVKAREEWDLALALDPGNVDAKAGLKRLEADRQGH